MEDLISKKGLLNKINAYVCGSQDKEFICKLIAEMPTIDAVEVVRCQYCVNHYDCTGVKLNCCLKTGIYVDDDEFCSKAERRTDG